MQDSNVRQTMIRRFLASLTVARVPETELLSITFRSRNPVLSAIVVNTLVDIYFSENFKLRYQSTQDIGAFLTGRLSDLQSKIQVEQNQLMTKGLKLGIIDLGSSSSSGASSGSSGSSTGTSTLVVETSELLDQRIKAQADLYLAQAELDNVRKNPNSVPPVDVPGSLELSALIPNLSAAQGQLASMTERYGAAYPGLAQQKAQVASIQKDIDHLYGKILSAAQQNVSRDQQIVDSLNQRISTLQSQSEASTPDIVQYEVLKSQYISDQTLYNTLLSTLGSGEIQTGMEAQVLNRFQVAEPPGYSSYPNSRLIIIVGFSGALFLSGVVVIIIVILSDAVESVNDIESILPVPVLASVPEYRQELKTTINDSVIPIVALTAPRSASTEAYRLLRTAITLMPAAQGCRVIVMTSGGPGEGKSTTVLNLAVVMATQSKRVLLIDADLRKPTIAQRLQRNDNTRPGLSRYLSDSSVLPEECIQPVEDVPGLDIFPVQEIPPFPSELLSQNRISELVAWAKEHYDYVLIDSPPILLVTDALIIAGHCDTILVVARIGVAQKRALARIRQDLAKYPNKQAGVIVNALPFSETYYRGYGNYKKYYGGGYSGYGGGSEYFQEGFPGEKDKGNEKPR